MLNNNISIKNNNHVNDNKLNQPKTKIEQVLPFDVVDPTKVTKPSKQNSSNESGQFNYNPDSVIDKFIKTLQESPVLSEGAKKILLNRQFINNNIKNDPVLNILFETFLENIEMNEPEILKFLKFQQGTYTKFHGKFFDNLRSILQISPQNKDLQMVIRNFLKSYDCFVSVDETSKSIDAALKNIERNIPEMIKKPFNDMTSNLIPENSKGIELNLSLLKSEIVPFIGRYISKMNDFGPVRDYVSVLVHNIVRLEAASKDNFADSLENMFEYIRYNFDVNDDYMESLRMSLINTYESSSKISNNSTESFLKLLESGIKESESLVNKGVMEEMTESLLFSQNVHIPLTHIFLPLNYNGLFMFSELWISKEYEESEDKKRKQDYVQAYKVFVTFDIQNVGYFETTLLLKESKLSLDIYVPSSLSNYMDKINNDLKKLLIKNDVSINAIRIQECSKRRKFNEVFSNIIERKVGVDVTI